MSLSRLSTKYVYGYIAKFAKLGYQQDIWCKIFSTCHPWKIMSLKYYHVYRIFLLAKIIIHIDVQIISKNLPMIYSAYALSISTTTYKAYVATYVIINVNFMYQTLHWILKHMHLLTSLWYVHYLPNLVYDIVHHLATYLASMFTIMCKVCMYTHKQQNFRHTNGYWTWLLSLKVCT